MAELSKLTIINHYRKRHDGLQNNYYCSSKLLFIFTVRHPIIILILCTLPVISSNF